jgi:hypothetical protein
MKQIKMIFTAIAVVAVVGGALAFKNASGFQNLFTCSANVCAISQYNTLSGTQVTNPGGLFTDGIKGTSVPCDATHCHTSYTAPVVFINP